MLLSEMNIEHATCIRDGEFDVLGLSNSQIRRRILTFLEDPRFVEEIRRNEHIACVLCSPDLAGEFDGRIMGIMTSPTPRVSFFALHNSLCKTGGYAMPEHDTKIGHGCVISDLAYIDRKNVAIGDNVVIEEFASIRGYCEIGDNVIIRAGSKIGGQGYEFKRVNGSYMAVEHAGAVKIGKNVEIWSDVTIHKAVYPWDATVVGDESRINSKVHIDHGAKIGNGVKICAGVVVSGRVHIGDYAFIGPNSSIANRVTIHENAVVSLGSVVTEDVGGRTRVSGNFAIDHALFIKHVKSLAGKHDAGL